VISISDAPDRYRHAVRAAQASSRSDGRRKGSSGTERPICFSVINIGEIERGIALQRPTDPRFSSALSEWLDRVLALCGERIVPFDLPTARRWGALSAALGNDSADLMIAATALEHGLAVVTHNISDFEPTGSPSSIHSAVGRTVGHNEVEDASIPSRGTTPAIDDLAFAWCLSVGDMEFGHSGLVRSRDSGRCCQVVLGGDEGEFDSSSANPRQRGEPETSREKGAEERGRGLMR